MTAKTARLAFLALLTCGAASLPAGAETTEGFTILPGADASSASPWAIGEGDKVRYAAIFNALRDQKWVEARAMITALDAGDAMRSVALSELYLAKDSPRVELFDLLDLLNKASWLPRADQLKRLAEKRGATMLPELPQVQKLMWLGAAPRREYVSGTKSDTLAQALSARIQGFVKADDPAGAEAALAAGEAGLTPEGLAEVRQRVAWAYYIENDDAGARRMAARALQAGAGGDWAVQAWWTSGLAAWRQDDCAAAAPAFVQVAGTAGNADMRAAGAYWAARAYMVCGQPTRVQTLLKTAARADETFYGLLARETLGLKLGSPLAAPRFGAVDWQQLKDSPNVRAAVALAAIGENGKADDVLRHQAKLGGGAQYDALLRLAGALSMPATQLYLAHNGPAGKQPASFARFPAPAWRPDGGWRVDPSLIFAHALQESGFRTDVVSSAGARGVMQVRPGTGSDMGTSPAALFVPSTNIEAGQRYLEALRDMSATGGLLPKVMAAYNAGPLPLARWNNEVRDKGDPLLFIESVPYYETRAYVNIVMRNYWMYQLQAKGSADCLTGMAQGMWPKFPTTTGTKMVRLSQAGGAAAGGGSD